MGGSARTLHVLLVAHEAAVALVPVKVVACGVGSVSASVSAASVVLVSHVYPCAIISMSSVAVAVAVAALFVLVTVLSAVFVEAAVRAQGPDPQSEPSLLALPSSRCLPCWLISSQTMGS